jgi:SAM-dependent methyltransferase
VKLYSPAAARNRAPIKEVLAAWLPATGRVLELASGGGEHALAFARAFPGLLWQPSDADAGALASIEARRVEEGSPNLLPPVLLDAADESWPIQQADALVAINLVHISPWRTSVGLLEGAARLLPSGGPLILYGPWRVAGEQLEPSNEAFDKSLKSRNPEWGLPEVGAFAEAAAGRGLELTEQRRMPANNRMLRFTRAG